MANKDFERMIQLGEWLESYLKSESKYWVYQDLANNFIELYNIDFRLSENDITIETLKIIDSEDPQKKELYFNYLTNEIGGLKDYSIDALISNTNHEKSKFDLLYDIQSDEGKKILSLIRDSLNEDELFETEIDDAYDWINFCQKKIARVLDMQITVKSAFQLIANGNRPWAHCLADNFKEKKHYYGKHLHRELAIGYNGLAEELNITKDGPKIKIVFRSSYSDCYSNFLHPSVFPWDVAASRIFFDFLLLGGQEYFLFCKHCGKFTVIRRKGRKKFCSDICRTNYGREKNPARI